MRWVLLAIGVIAVLVGIVWTLQGVGILRGSVMTGVVTFAVIGPILALVGLALIVFGLIRRGAPSA